MRGYISSDPSRGADCSSKSDMRLSIKILPDPAEIFQGNYPSCQYSPGVLRGNPGEPVGSIGVGSPLLFGAPPHISEDQVLARGLFLGGGSALDLDEVSIRGRSIPYANSGNCNKP